MKKIVCMGSVNMDLVMFAESIPIPGQTLVTDNFQTFPGGKGGNQAVAASKLGADVTYFTKLGTDSFSEELTAVMSSSGVNMDCNIQLKGGTAGIAMIMVDKNGQNSILFTPGANAQLTPQDVLANKKVFEECDILLITLEINVDTAYEAIKLAKSLGKTVVLDPAPVPQKPIPKEIARSVDFVKPNETEAKSITNIDVVDYESGELALKALVDYGFASPMISMGKMGVLTIDQNVVKRLPVVDLKPVDTTAAGDVFLGGFVAALSKGWAFLDAIEFAQTAAAISVTRKGAQSSIPNLDEVNQLYKKSKK